LTHHVAERGDRLVNDLRDRSVFNVVTEDDVNVVHAEPLQALIDALPDAVGREVEVLGAVAVPADLRGQDVAVARNFPKATAEDCLGASTSVIWRRIKIIDPDIERALQTIAAVEFVGGAERAAERRGSQTEP